MKNNVGYSSNKGDLVIENYKTNSAIPKPKPIKSPKVTMTFRFHHAYRTMEKPLLISSTKGAKIINDDGYREVSV